MKLVANVKLLPTAEQARLLRRTLEQCNVACSWLSAQAWESQVFGQYALQKLCYAELRERFALTAQVAIRSIAKVADAYNIATDSMGERHDGAAIESKRERYVKRRAGLQRTGSKAAKRRLKNISGRQSRYQQIVNHTISKAIVSKAERYSLAIALEDLTHIRARVKANKEQRKRLHNWGFGHLRANADHNAAGNISRRGLVTGPMFAHHRE